MIDCWYCNSEEDLSGGWYFSCEWDCDVHYDCLMKVLKADPNDMEAEIMKREFNITDKMVADYREKE